LSTVLQTNCLWVETRELSTVFITRTTSKHGYKWTFVYCFYRQYFYGLKPKICPLFSLQELLQNTGINGLLSTVLQTNCLWVETRDLSTVFITRTTSKHGYKWTLVHCFYRKFFSGLKPEICPLFSLQELLQNMGINGLLSTVFMENSFLD
jgi:hypothetical protein